MKTLSFDISQNYQTMKKITCLPARQAQNSFSHENKNLQIHFIARPIWYCNEITGTDNDHIFPDD